MKRSKASEGNLRQLALRNAATIACKHSKSKEVATTANDYCKFAKSAIEFEILALTTEQSLLNDFATIETESEKLETLFELFVLSNQNSVGKMCAEQLSRGLGKIHGSNEFKEKISTAIEDSVSDRKTQLDIQSFKKVMNILIDKIGCSMDELAQIIIIECVFSSTADLVNGGISAKSTPSFDDDVSETNSESEFHKALLDERMQALFALFDMDHDGLVDFKDIVLGMYKVTEQIDGASKAAVNAMLVFDENHVHALNYEEFTKLIINVVAASPDHVKFKDVADDMTRHAAKPIDLSSDDVSHLFAMDTCLEVLNNLEGDEKKQSDERELSRVEASKVNRLFDIWDLDHDGYISLQDLALGLRKFQETTQIRDTVTESIRVMTAFDKNNDEKLDRKEFADFIKKFASMLELSNLGSLIDFMLVTQSLKKNSEAETAYINSIKASDIYYWGC